MELNGVYFNIFFFWPLAKKSVGYGEMGESSTSTPSLNGV